MKSKYIRMLGIEPKTPASTTSTIRQCVGMHRALRPIYLVGLGVGLVGTFSQGFRFGYRFCLIIVKKKNLPTLFEFGRWESNPGIPPQLLKSSTAVCGGVYHAPLLIYSLASVVGLVGKFSTRVP
jgi:hypothetical protein